jgi:hypothetical protein
LALEVACNDDNGIRVEPSTKDLKALINMKRQKYDVSNDLRKLLEATLKEICFACEVKTAFRYNDQNERRMTGELLSELRATVNRKCSDLKGDPIFSQLEGSNLIATVGSHDNSESITGGDIDVALGDIFALEKFFYVPTASVTLKQKARLRANIRSLVNVEVRNSIGNDPEMTRRLIFLMRWHEPG